MQNIIILGRDNPVKFEFAFSGEFASNGLNNFNAITLNIGNESYSLGSNLIIESNTVLVLSIGDTTALTVGNYSVEIIGFSPTYDDGYVLTCAKYNNIQSVKVIEC